MHVRKVGSRKFYFKSSQLLWIALVGTLQLARAALRTRADVYHVCKPHPMNGLAGLIASKLRRRPFYLDCDDYETTSNQFSRDWQRRVVNFFEERLPAVAAGITVNTHFTLERLKRSGYPDEQIVYVPNGVDRHRFSGADDAVARMLRRQLGLVDRKVVLYVGSLSLASHAVDQLLEAFVIVRQAEPRAILLLVGGGGEYEALQSQVEALKLSDEVQFVGWIPPDQVPSYYLLADVSVDPMRDDPTARARSPLKVVESLVTGTPIITGDVGDWREMLTSGGGLLVPPGDVTALAQSLVSILGDDELRVRLSAQALEVCRQYYWDVLVHRFAKVYEAESQELGQEGK
jgi:glycosyltransferase involved in cell wall biosynthesis